MRNIDTVCIHYDTLHTTHDTSPSDKTKLIIIVLDPDPHAFDILYRIGYDARSHLELNDGSPDLVLLGAHNIQEPVQLRNKESQFKVANHVQDP
jgi:hypothetical protein